MSDVTLNVNNVYWYATTQQYFMWVKRRDEMMMIFLACGNQEARCLRCAE